MEHIIVSSLSTHLDTNNILNLLQHGFRKRLSGCDSQLLSLFHDLASVPTETDMIVTDVSKAFDKVPHRRLLYKYKLEWYGIRGGTLDWIKYACMVQDPHTQVNIRRLDSVQMRAAGHVCNHWHNTSSMSAMLHELSWESLARQRQRASMIYKVVHGLVDIPWLRKKVLNSNPQCTRGTHSWKYAPILPHNDTFKFSFIPHTIIGWNALPPVVVDCTSLNSFRAALSDM